MKAIYFRSLLLLSCAFTASESSAVTLTSLDRATFQTAISGATTLGVQDFDSLVDQSTLTSLDGVTYGASTGLPLVTSGFLTSTNPNGLGRTGVGFFLDSDSATFSFANSITAFAIDVNTFASQDGSYFATLNTGDTVDSIFETFVGQQTGQFIGFVSDSPFSSVTISARALAGDNRSYTLDTLIYGAREAVTSPVPEPATWAMLLVGFGAVGATMRRRQQVAVRFA